MPVTEAFQSPPSGLLLGGDRDEPKDTPMKLHRHARPDVGVSSSAAPSANSSTRERLRAVPNGEPYLYHAGARSSSGANGGGTCLRTLIEWGARVGIGTVYRVPAEVLQRA